MRVERLEELARQALAESRRNDCEIVSVNVAADAEHSWSISLLDVMQKQEPFSVKLEAAPASTDEEIKEAIRRGIAEHFSATSY